MTYSVVMKSAQVAAGAALLQFGPFMYAQAPSPVKTLGPVVTQPAASAAAGKQPATSSAVPSPGSHAMTAEDIGAFLDGMVPQQLALENIAGAVVIVVKDGTVLFQKGYGYADMETLQPMTADGTLVRPGSVSKLFTWTAVMQQVEAGKIDLDRDINDYLDFKIPATYLKPITMRNLMTHTSGFDEVEKDLFVDQPRPSISTDDYIRTHLPRRVYPPGTTPAYSNYGATLAGYIVERVSGIPFDDYVDTHIFGPLAMTHTTFCQPPPEQLLAMTSKAYTLATEKPKPYEIINAEPAGSSLTSAVDISHFMLAHLQGGEWNGVRILKPETAALMHSRQFGVNPVLSHMALGFYEENRNGHRIIGHAGDTNYFHSDLHLIQDANLGFFMSYNSAGRGNADTDRKEIFNSFLDRYFPYTVPAASKPADAAGDAKLVAGEYIGSRRSVTTILSAFFFPGNLKVVPGQDGTIVVDGLKGEDQVPRIWEEIGPLLYRTRNGQSLVGFTRDSDNRLVLSFDYPFEVFTRVGLADSKGFNLLLLEIVSLILLLTLICWPVSAWMRRHYGHPLALTHWQQWLRRTIRIVVAIDVVFILCWAAVVVASGGKPLFAASLDPMFRVIQVIGWIGSLGTLMILYAVVTSWRTAGEWWLTHMGYVAVALSAVGFSWFLLHWHLLAFSLRY